MMLAAYGVWDDAIGTPAEMTDYLLDSYLRRRRWEWEQQAIHMVNALGAALTDEKPKKRTDDPLRALARLGVKVPEVQR